MPKSKPASTNATLANLESTLEEYFVDKAPFQLPEGAKEGIVKFGPWVLLVLMIMALPALLALLGLGAALTPFAVIGGGSPFTMLPALVSLVALVIEAFALPGLFKRQLSAWNLVFIAQLVSIVGSLLAMDIIGAILGALIGFYILFQIKEKYS